MRRGSYCCWAGADASGSFVCTHCTKEGEFPVLVANALPCTFSISRTLSEDFVPKDFRLKTILYLFWCLSAALLLHSEGSGIWSCQPHIQKSQQKTHAGPSSICARTVKPKSPINRAHWLSSFSVHSFPFWTNFWTYYASWKNRCKFPSGY